MAKTPEGVVVEYAKKHLKDKGCLVRKISYEMRRGCPDLLVGAYGGRVLFLEIKKDEDTKPDDHQIREHERMRAVGMDVRVIGSKRQVDELIKDLFPCD